jgi:Ca2+-transporting ATPase
LESCSRDLSGAGRKPVGLQAAEREECKAMIKSIPSAQDFLATLHGLSEAEAADRLKTEGPNELPTAKPHTFFATAWGVLKEPMILLLLGAGAIYFFLGELRDSIILLGSIVVVVGIDLYQERKTEHALEALQNLSSPRAVVLRGGQQRRIPGREVVRGDVVIVSEGDRIPADGVLISAVNLSVDESLLTGESVPVREAASDQAANAIGLPGGDGPSLCVFGNYGCARPGICGDQIYRREY